MTFVCRFHCFERLVRALVFDTLVHEATCQRRIHITLLLRTVVQVIFDVGDLLSQSVAVGRRSRTNLLGFDRFLVPS